MNAKKKFKIISVEGKYYTQLGLYDGHIRLGQVLDLGNNITKEGKLYDMIPYYYPSTFTQNWYFCIRLILEKIGL